jgi:hypothetical protein
VTLFSALVAASVPEATAVFGGVPVSGTLTGTFLPSFGVRNIISFILA